MFGLTIIFRGNILLLPIYLSSPGSVLIDALGRFFRFRSDESGEDVQIMKVFRLRL